jgi:hypothetical protein
MPSVGEGWSNQNSPQHGEEYKMVKPPWCLLMRTIHKSYKLKFPLLALCPKELWDKDKNIQPVLLIINPTGKDLCPPAFERTHVLVVVWRCDSCVYHEHSTMIVYSKDESHTVLSQQARHERIYVKLKTGQSAHSESSQESRP